jgi:hypothetical protein
MGLVCVIESTYGFDSELRRLCGQIREMATENGESSPGDEMQRVDTKNIHLPVSFPEEVIMDSNVADEAPKQSVHELQSSKSEETVLNDTPRSSCPSLDF